MEQKSTSSPSISRVEIANSQAAEAIGNIDKERIDTVRHILFGEQTAFLEGKIQRVEDEIHTEVSTFRKTVTTRISALEELVKKEFKELHHKIDEETKNRHRVVGELEGSIRDFNGKNELSSSELSKKLDDLEAANLSRANGLRDDLKAFRRQVDEEIARKLQALAQESVEANDLATALIEVAKRLKLRAEKKAEPTQARPQK